MMRAWLVVVACAAACNGGGESCDTEGAVQCAGDTLQVCTDGEFTDSQDCAADGQVCDDSMGHCMAASGM
jgi:hypothetical protein